MSDLYHLSEERALSLLDKALIVFDTNAICELYRMTKDTQHTMLEILDHFKDRLWIPAQVLYEYRKNRIGVIKEPIKRWYSNPDFFRNNYKDQLKQFIHTIEEESYYHPYFDEYAFHRLKNQKDIVFDSMNELCKIVSDEFDKRKKEILKLEESDNILDKVLTMPTGAGFSFGEKLEIMKEGEWRYKEQLPPGYMDCSEKHGIDKYGDLIIWKEILTKAKKDDCSVLFITNDVKIDWYEEHEKRREPSCPRHELLQEFKEFTGKDIWFFTLNQFIHKLEVRYKDESALPFYTGLEEVKRVLQYMKKQKEYEEKLRNGKLARVMCCNCKKHFTVNVNDFDFDWEDVGSTERNMGMETEYMCEEYFECPQCGHECKVAFHVWEYPVGVYNYDDIVAYDCTIRKEDIDLSDYISFEEIEPCVFCGVWDSLDSDGLCPVCAEERDRNVLE